MKSELTLINKLSSLSHSRLKIVDQVVDALLAPCTFAINPSGSDIINDDGLQHFGDVLRMHHEFSTAPFSKDKFEHGLAAALNNSGVKVDFAPKGNPGYDIKIMGVKTSLKTQADKNTQVDKIHVSKWMELGKGKWGDKIEDLEKLRDRLIEHMNDYDRIFTLRALKRGDPIFFYELVEIPKSLIARCKGGKLEFASETSQQGGRPGYCTVTDDNRNVLFKLYFDGGSERKLQVKHLLKSECIVHATWQFPNRHSSSREAQAELI